MQINWIERCFKLEQLPQNTLGVIREQDLVNIHATEKMGDLHDQLKTIGMKVMT